MPLTRITRFNHARQLWLLAIAIMIGWRSIPAVAQDPKLAPPPVMLPYLQNPSAEAMTICYLSRDASEITVVWGKDAPSTLTQAQRMVVPNTPWTHWRTRLTGLTPATTYYYQIKQTIAGVESRSATYQFTTPDPKGAIMKALVFNDIHDHRETITSLMKHVTPDDYDFVILNGDMINDPSPKDGAKRVIEIWNFYVELLGGHSKPIIFVRGNHELRGGFTRQLPYLFDHPELSTTQAPAEEQWALEFTSGPVRILAMDTGEDDDLTTPENSYKQPKFWQASRQRQLQWLKQHATPVSPKRWNLFVSHIPLHNPAGWFSLTARDYWLPELKKANINLMIAGHDHSWKFLPAGKTFKIAGKPTEEDTPAFPVMIGGGPSMNEGTVIILRADDHTLRARMLNTHGKVLYEFNS